MTMPNFIIIGAMKSGTTSLHRYLNQHPQIYMTPRKELDFFALEDKRLDFDGPEGKKKINRHIKRNCPTNIEDYRASFRGVSNETAIGEASTLYLYSPEAPGRIRRYLPEVKLIAVLRNPVERAYSAFLHTTRDYRETFDKFSQALQAEEPRIRDNWQPVWHYKNAGFYYVQLRRYFDIFEQDQIKIYLYEDLKADPLNVVHSICRFLGVDDTFSPETSLRHNATGVPKSKALSKLINRPNAIKTVLKPFLPEGLRWHILASLQNRNLEEPPPLTSEVRGCLIEVYRQDIAKLEELIERDLSGWLEVTPHKKEESK